MVALDSYGRGVLLDTLLLFDEVCKKLNIKYYLSHGTLLGSIKYKGFIPWEDDLDIMMYRKDFNILKNYFLKNPNEKWCLGGGECGFFSMDFFCKFFNKKYYCLEEGRLLTHSWVDIYILSEVKKEKMNSYCKELKFVLALASLANKKVKYEDWYDSDIKIWFYYNFHQKQIGSKKLSDKHLYKVLTKYVKDFNGYFLMSPGVFHIIDEKLYDADWFNGEDVTVEFEGHKFLAPSGYDDILKKTYGDYMNTLPPESEQKPKHGTIFLRENEYVVATYKYL